MNSYTRKHFVQENNATALSPKKHNALPDKGKDTEKPFPCKAVFHKKTVNFSSHALDSKEKCVSNTSKKHGPNSAPLKKESLRLPAGEAHMSRVIQEKQLMLQKKLWKVEDTLRQKIQQDNDGAHINCHLTRDDKYSEKEEMTKPDTKTKKGTQATDREEITDTQKNPKNKFRQDTVTKRHEPQDDKRSNVHAVKNMSNRKEAGRTTYVNEPIQKKPVDLSTGDINNAARSSLHEELVLPQVSSNPSRKPELSESEVKNIQLLPCHICHRNFLHNRVEKHIQICEKASKSKRPVFNSYANRTKGSAAEQFFTTHTRSRTPEVIRKKKQRRNNKK